MNMREFIDHLRKLGNGEVKPKRTTLGVCNEVVVVTSSLSPIRDQFYQAIIAWAESKGVNQTFPIEGDAKAFYANQYKWSGTAKNNRRLQMCLELADILEKEHGTASN